MTDWIWHSVDGVSENDVSIYLVHTKWSVHSSSQHCGSSFILSQHFGNLIEIRGDDGCMDGWHFKVNKWWTACDDDYIVQWWFFPIVRSLDTSTVALQAVSILSFSQVYLQCLLIHWDILSSFSSTKKRAEMGEYGRKKNKGRKLLIVAMTNPLLRIFVLLVWIWSCLTLCSLLSEYVQLLFRKTRLQKVKSSELNWFWI